MLPHTRCGEAAKAASRRTSMTSGWRTEPRVRASSAAEIGLAIRVDEAIATLSFARSAQSGRAELGCQASWEGRESAMSRRGDSGLAQAAGQSHLGAAGLWIRLLRFPLYTPRGLD